jgi:hypothetical protein
LADSETDWIKNTVGKGWTRTKKMI